MQGAIISIVKNLKISTVLYQKWQLWFLQLYKDAVQTCIKRMPSLYQKWQLWFLQLYKDAVQTCIKRMPAATKCFANSFVFLFSVTVDHS